MADDEPVRDHILADFQACTGLENIEECIAVLEQHDWDLANAVNSAMSGLDTPQASTSPAGLDIPPPYTEAVPGFGPVFSHVASSAFTPVVPRAESAPGLSHPGISPYGGATSGPSLLGQPSTSSGFRPMIRMLNFTVEYRDKEIPLVLGDNETVGKIKELLVDKLSVPKDKQVLGGWVNKNDKRVLDDDILRDLKLPKENRLFLLTPDIRGPPVVQNNGEDAGAVIERLSQTFTLNIRHLDSGRTFRLDFPGSKTVQEVKHDMDCLINVPVRHQVWTGWPEAASDESMTLAGCGINYPCHCLEVSKNKPTSSNGTQKQEHEETIEIDASDEEFEDAHDSFHLEEDIFSTDVPMSQRNNPLMPENAKDQQEALECFMAEFSNRYGHCHPLFYIGKLEDAIKEALQTRVKDRKLLAIYLHHDSSIQANVFCSHILCTEHIAEYLNHNFVTWAWDLTSDINRARLLNMCTEHFGSVVANTVRNFKPDELPILLLISRNRSTNEVVNVVHANVTLEELMSQLVHAVEQFNEQRQAELREEELRDAREQMKAEQDAAYEASLAADRAKAEAKRIEEEQKMQREMEEEKVRQEEALKRKQEEDEKEAIRLSIEDQLPDEPAEDCGLPLSKIRIRAPQGETITRRFLADNPLQILINFIISKGYHIDDYKVLTTFPRRDLKTLDMTKSLQEHKLVPQETVILEEISTD